jgi:DNA-directed RNA polymerase beta subunit
MIGKYNYPKSLDDSFDFRDLPKTLYPFLIPELKLSKESALFRKLLKRYGLGQNALRVYNHWTDKQNGHLSIMEEELLVRTVKTPYGNFTFHDPEIQKPMIMVSGKNVPLTPKMARDMGSTYMAELFVTIKFTPLPQHRKDNPECSVRTSMGKLPIPLRCKFCHLHDKTDKELIEMGETPNDPFTYFIIKGTEKAIIIQEKLRPSQFFSFYDTKTGLLEGRITTTSPWGTSVVAINVGKQWTSLKVKLAHIKGKLHIPLFILFLFLGISIDDAVNTILKYVKEKNRIIVYYGLQASISKGLSHPEYFSYWATKRGLDRNNPAKTLKTIISDINRDCFANIPTREMSEEEFNLYKEDLRREGESFIPYQPPQIEKAEHLAMMTARMVETLQGLRNVDDRDSWSNKRLEIGPRSLEQLFVSAFDVLVNNAQKNTDEELGKVGDIKMTNKKGKDGKFVNKDNLLYILSLKPGKDITEQLESSFNSNAWGLKGSKRRENLTEDFRRSGTLDMQSEVDKINTPANRNAPRRVREIQGSQLGTVCIAETPEGENCGLVKHLAMTTVLSLERKKDIFYSFIENEKDLYRKEKEEGFDMVFLMNGIIIGWCKREMKDRLLLGRRRGELPLDCCIIENEDDGVIEYNAEASRPCRPLLIVNKDTQQLVIDEKNLWDADIDTLYKEGAMELLDIREIEYGKYLIAQFVDEVRERKKKLAELKRRKTELSKRRRHDRDELISNEEYEHLMSLYVKIQNDDDVRKVMVTLSNMLLQNITVDSIARYSASVEDKDLKRGVLILTRFFMNVLKERSVEDLHSDFGLLYNNYKELHEEMDIDISLKELMKKRMPTHSEIHPIAAFGISAGLIPNAESNAGPRVVFQTNMGKQAASQIDVVHEQKMSYSGYKLLARPSRSLWETEIADPAYGNVMPAGQTCLVGILMQPENMEDAIVFSSEFLETKNFEIVKYSVYKSVRKQEGDILENFAKPASHIGEAKGRYDAIDDFGIPRIGAFLREGDCVIGKLREIKSTMEKKKAENASTFIGVGDEGYVERVYINMNESREWVVRVKVAILRKYIVGDKAASRYSQKGTVGSIKSIKNLPRIASGRNRGVVPDILINPLGQPTRSAIGMIKELECSKAAVYSLERVNATTYNKQDLKYWQKVLQDAGLNEMGLEKMCHPNGQMLKGDVFVGLCTYQALRHHVKDKIQLRARGNIRPMTRQPMSGRVKRGGLRVGEMERDAIIEHGASALLIERLMVVSDESRAVYCANCGNVAINDVMLKGNKMKCTFCKPSVAKFYRLTFPRIYLVINRLLNAIGIGINLSLMPEIEQGQKLEAKVLV